MVGFCGEPLVAIYIGNPVQGFGEKIGMHIIKNEEGIHPVADWFVFHFF
jgi:hypothetical protein